MADNLSALLANAFTIYSDAYSKIGRVGLKVVQLKGKPAQPKLWKELAYAVSIFSVIEPSIVLNGGGTAIVGIVGDVDVINNLLLRLKRAVKIFPGNEFPTPLTGYTFVTGESGADADASYITAIAEGTLGQSRRLTQGVGISLTDGGPAGNMMVTNTAAISAVEVDTSVSPIVLDMDGLMERFFYGSVPITGLRTWQVINAGTARRIKLNFVISNMTPGDATRDQTFPPEFKSSDARWHPDVVPYEWRPIEDGEYTAEAFTFNGVDWIIEFSDIIS